MGEFTRNMGRKSKVQWTPFEPAGHSSPVGDEPCYVNNLYQVTIATHKSGWEHLSVVRRDRSAIHDWRHLQRIKNELCGPEREGVELYPAESRLVDTNNQYHLWVAPKGMSLPIGYAGRDVSEPDGARRK